jgi:hypothetical protein
LLLVVLALTWAAAQGRMRAWVPAVYAGVLAATYTAYGYLIMSSPARARALVAQMGHAGGTAGSMRKLEFLAASIFAPNLERGSAFSICLLLVLGLLLAQLVAPLLKRQAAAKSGSALFDLAFVGVAMAPTLYLNYVGPRIVPLYLVAILLLFRRVAGLRDVKRLVFLVNAAAAVNYLGDVILVTGYLGVPRGVLSAFLGPSFVLLLLAISMLAAARWASVRPHLAAAGLVSVSCVSLAMYGTSLRAHGFRVTDGNIASVSRHLSATDYAGKAIVCDLSVHYLSLIEDLRYARIYSTFPFLYFDRPDFFRRYVDSVIPDVVLATTQMFQNLARSPANGLAFADTLRTAFAGRDTFTVGGVKTWVYVRR